MIQIHDKNDCYGCFACEASCPVNAIKMIEDEEGFKYPHVDTATCIECNKCVKVCPKKENAQHLVYEKGEVYSALNDSLSEYISSSSGGVFIGLCKQIISLNGIVVGATYDNEFNVKHSIAETVAECERFKGSKYTQSSLDNIFIDIKKYLENNRLVLFSGTPCQVAGLKKFLNRSYDNLITCDLICHGVPSPLLFRDYLKFLGDFGKITCINMKSKVQNDYRTALRVDYSDGKSYRQNLKTSIWNRIYFGHYAIRPSCTTCQFTSFNRTGDITIGDFWGVHKYINQYPKDKAISLVLINTQKGKKLFEALNSELITVKSNEQEAEQPSLLYPVTNSPERDDFWKDYKSRGFNYIIRKYCGYTLFARFKEAIKELIK